MKLEEWKLIVRRIERSQHATEREIDELVAIIGEVPMEMLSRPVPQASGGILFYAARHAHAAVLAALVRRGVDPRALPEAGRYPLYSACCGLERLDNGNRPEIDVMALG